MTDLRLYVNDDPEPVDGWPMPKIHWWDRLLAWLFQDAEPLDRKNIP